MRFEFPAALRYRASHEWVTVDDDTARVGITAFSQHELGDVVFVELPVVGDELHAGEPFGVVESVKVITDLYAPVSGTVTAVNDRLFDRPTLVNEDPYGDGWLLEVESVGGVDSGSDSGSGSEFDREHLLTASEYREQVM